jgi:3',5'-cyclic AMP phosphodiesterase CpdA
MSIHASTRPYFSVMGNHEQNGDLGANMRYFLNYPYISPYGKYYSFNYSNAHFCFIDVYDNPLADGDWVSDRQYAWLSQDLANNKGKNWIFCFFHDPIYSTGDFGMNKESEAQLGKIFYENQVDIVVNGHDHHYEAFWVNSTESWGGTYYFVSGGAGGNLDTGIMKRTNNRWLTYYHNASKNPYQQDYVTLHNQIYGELVHHFLYFEINGDNMQIKAIRLNGTLIQEFKIRR